MGQKLLSRFWWESGLSLVLVGIWVITSDVLHDIIVCKIYVFTDSQRSRLFFLMVENVLAVFTRWLAALDCKPHELELKN